MLEPFSGNEKMVIAVPNDKINYCNLFVVLPLMNHRVTLKLSFERDSNRISALSRKTPTSLWFSFNVTADNILH